MPILARCWAVSSAERRAVRLSGKQSNRMLRWLLLLPRSATDSRGPPDNQPLPLYSSVIKDGKHVKKNFLFLREQLFLSKFNLIFIIFIFKLLSGGLLRFLDIQYSIQCKGFLPSMPPYLQKEKNLFYPFCYALCSVSFSRQGNPLWYWPLGWVNFLV